MVLPAADLLMHAEQGAGLMARLPRVYGLEADDMLQHPACVADVVANILQEADLETRHFVSPAVSAGVLPARLGSSAPSAAPDSTGTRRSPPAAPSRMRLASASRVDRMSFSSSRRAKASADHD